MKGRIIKVNNDAAIFDEKKKVIISFNNFIKRYAAVNGIEYKLEQNEVRNHIGGFIELFTLNVQPGDVSLVWTRFYRNIFAPTIDSLLIDNIFPSQATVNLFNEEWKKMKVQSDDIFSTPINSSDTSKSFVW